LKTIALLLFLAAVTALLAGCAQTRSMIVLLPDSDGQVGSVYVKTGQGAVTLKQPFNAVTAAGREAPTAPETVQEPAIASQFEKALAVEPAQQFRLKKWILYCRNNLTELTPASQEHWPEVVRQLIAEPPLELYAIGHTDSVGTESYNQQLSRDRALTIEQALAAAGINPKIIRVAFLGQSSPMVMTPDKVPEPRNRRVELVAKYSKSKEEK
jgi:outer membrane protein OmpA-like peptidoglycan-associated protein